MKNTVILFGSSTGNTESVAKEISKKLENADVFDVASFSAPDVHNYQNLILGTSTWGIGDLQDDWESFLSNLSTEDLSDKTIALFGLGDCESYPDSFVDGIGIIYEEIKDKAGAIVGFVETEGFSFDDSKAVYNGKFVGLPLDEDNESDLTESRIDSWLEEILPHFS